MPAYQPTLDFPNEPKQRFYPPQDAQPQSRPRIPSTPTRQTAVRSLSEKKGDDATYLLHRHPILLQRLYHAADTLLNTYLRQDFIYDAYPDYVSLHLMRDRILRENTFLTEEFLQSGCPIEWLNLLTDTVISELLCRKRCSHRNPMGDANTTSVQSISRS